MTDKELNQLAKKSVCDTCHSQSHCYNTASCYYFNLFVKGYKAGASESKGMKREIKNKDYYIRCIQRERDELKAELQEKEK